MTSADATVMEVLNALVDRLASEFPDVPAAQVRQVVTAAWSMFTERADGRQDEEARAAVTEWYARRRLADGE